MPDGPTTAKGRQVRECGCVYEWQTVRDRQVVRVMLCWEHLPESDKWITIDVPGVS